MNSSETMSHKKIGFDNQKYLEFQQNEIRERMSHFTEGTLYLEIGGKFLYDPHAQRVLPGFDAYVKPKIIKGLNISYEIIFCVNAKDIASNRMLNNNDENYVDATIRILSVYKQQFPVQFSVAINMVQETTPEIEQFRAKMTDLKIPTYLRYIIQGYPNPEVVVSTNGYAKDEYIKTSSPLVLVIGPASNSGKMSTCLGQIYHDEQHDKDSGYAKYELFPIWNLPLKHPVNLAYEAATADIGDYNLYDYHHKNAHQIDAVNYNRDVEAFPIITSLLNKIIPQTNYMQNYKSPTDMGMNKAGFAIIDDLIVAQAALEEIVRRKEWFQEQFLGQRGEEKWVQRCEEIEQEAMKYFQS